MAGLTFVPLDNIALGTLTPREAQERIASFRGRLDKIAAERIYTVLKAWVWRAIYERRRDDELREWFGVIRATSKFLAMEKFDEASVMLKAISEMLEESIAVADDTVNDQIFERAHMSEALERIREEGDGFLERHQLGKFLGLKESNLTRVMNVLSNAGLVEGRRVGKTVVYRLTPEGKARPPLVRANVSPQNHTEIETVAEAYASSGSGFSQRDHTERYSDISRLNPRTSRERDPGHRGYPTTMAPTAKTSQAPGKSSRSRERDYA
ncbi:hypothetical protein C8J31_11442 [Rhizobium sp. PP-CC-2G-626]|nr:hypothetical protein C8J31_11442 [Rhizobium sp. PP-CC-2G-626]